MCNGLGNRQSLDALRAPFRGYLLARDTPDFFRVRLEEGAIQTGSKTVDEKIFQGCFGRSGRNLRPAIAQSDLEGFEEP
jgi:hypothetical protein